MPRQAPGETVGPLLLKNFQKLCRDLAAVGDKVIQVSIKHNTYLPVVSYSRLRTCKRSRANEKISLLHSSLFRPHSR